MSRGGSSGAAAPLLAEKGLAPTPRRVAVLQTLLQSRSPLAAPDILQAARKGCDINKATLYRILDLLVANDLALRHSAGERSFRYCALAPAALHDSAMHCHFHCLRCGAMQCLENAALLPDCSGLQAVVQGTVQSVEVRLDGLCQTCSSAPDSDNSEADAD